MKVKELIKQLKELPQNAPVAFTLHDNEDCEIQALVTSVDLIDMGKYPDNWQRLKGDFVILR